MAKIGLSKPYAARYGNNGETVTYTGGALMGKAVQMSIELDSADDNILYADNGPAESENTFSGGTMKLTTDDLMPNVMLEVLGVTEKAIAESGIQTTEPKWYVWDDKQETPYMGFGAIAMIQKDLKVKYQAVILPKIKFTNPNDTFSTKGEKIEWGTPEISGNIHRSDVADHPWKMSSSPMDSEADAEAAIKAFLNIAGE